MAEEFNVNSADVSATRALLDKLMVFLRAKPRRYKVVVTQCQEKKTDAMRRYYHVAMVELFRSFLREQGESYTHDRVHEDLKDRFRKRIPVVDLLTGEIVRERIQRNEDMSNDDWHEYIELVTHFLTDDVGLNVQDSRNYYDQPGKAVVRGCVGPHGF